MSQFYQGVTTGVLPPAVPLQFTEDDSTVAIPVANNLNVLSRDTTDNNANGIQTTADPNGGDDLYIELTNRFHGSSTTVGATTADVVTFALGATPGTFFFYFDVALFDSSTPSGAGYSTYTTVRTDGASATLIGDTDAIVHEEASLVTTEAEVVVSANNAIFRVTGVAGLTINWTVTGNYIKAT